MGRTTPRSSDQHAGEWESLFIHLVDKAFDCNIIQFAEQWDQIGGLNHEQRTALQKFAFLCKSIDKVAYIKQNRHTTPAALPALPLDHLLSESVQWIRPGCATQQQAWLRALGLGEGTLIKAADGALTLIPSSALEAAARQQNATAAIPPIKLKLPSHHNGGAHQPYFKVMLEAGPFAMHCSDAVVIKSGPDAGKIKVEGRLHKGAVLCRGTFSYRWESPLPGGSNNQEIFLPQLAFTPQLTEDLNSHFYFILDGSYPRVDRIEWSPLKIALGILPLPSSLNALWQTFESVRSAITTEVSQLLERLAFTDVFTKQGRHGTAQLQSELLKTLQSNGASPASGVTLRSIETLSLQDGSLAAQVRLSVYKGPKLPGADVLRKLLSQRR